MHLDTQKLCSVVEGCFLNRVPRFSFRGVSIDSRDSDLEQKIFFAIQGVHFDGHDFLQQALKAGAGALIVHKEISFKTSLAAVIKVNDTLKALHRLAFWWRNKLSVSVIGITGSTGKTTTKNFCKTLLEDSFSVIASPKSFNNIYGVPLTLLSANENTNIIVQEIGMNQKGEIKSLCELTNPDIVTVTQIGSSHIGILGSKEEIAKEKMGIYLYSQKAIFVFNEDDPYTKAMYKNLQNQRPGCKTILFSSRNEKADIFLQIKEVKKNSLSVFGHFQGVKGSTSVPVIGRAHLNNLLAGGALALAAGLKEGQIWERLSLCQLPSGRNEWSTLPSGAQVLFDAYNASPESVRALLDYFLSPVVSGKKILILGDFLELGTYLTPFQKELAEKLANSEVALIWFIGTQADSFTRALKKAGYTAELYSSKHFASQLAKKILSMLNPSVTLAFKASRKAQLEKVLFYLGQKNGL